MPLVQRPSYLGGAPAVSTAAKLAGGLGVAQPPRISLKDDRFTCLTAQGERDPRVQPSFTLDVIILGANEHASRVYYEDAYDADDAAAPSCWSDNGEAPSAQAQSPQAARCDACPQAVWGSRINAQGNKVPACSSKKKIAVMVAGCGDTIFLLTVPPASLKGLRAYVAHLGNMPAEPHEVITRLAIEDKTVQFDTVDWVPEAAAPLVLKMVESPEIDVVVGALDKPRGAQTALPPRQEQRQITASPEDRREPPPAQNGFGGHAPPASFSPPPPPVETPEQREAREFAEWKASKAAQTPNAGAAAESPKTRRTRGRAAETVVGPGPVPASAFAPPQQSFAPAAPQGAPAASFGMNPNPPAPSSEMERVLAAAMGPEWAARNGG